MIGQSFGSLLVLREAASDKKGKKRWLCRCTCGNFTIVYGFNLTSNSTQSCGCSRQKDNAGYRAVHLWLTKIKPKPEFCELCKEQPAEQLSYNHKDSKEYSRNPDDYNWLCTSCHCFKDRGSNTVITKTKIRRIRELCNKGATQRELATLFRVDCGTINNIVNYRGHYQKTINPSIFKELIQGLERNQNA